ncbi:hypothetical protein [Emticicia agri]|uniref:Uncharacterized protein n=1 Tax=Emticicia agri TaxID=2492393 RepID=A0A4Q5LUQ6_9BACT|nr:hypothetical protein [Emticicia agri]RYU93362.1 hypothetical protein EWM59_22555 [Emticicia agri]
MNRYLNFIEVNNRNIQTNLSQLISEDIYLEDLFKKVEADNQLKSIGIDYAELLYGINNNPNLLKYQELNFLYRWTLNIFWQIYDKGFMRSLVYSEVQNHGFYDFFLLQKTSIIEVFLQELWNFLDPLKKYKFIPKGYILSQPECYNFVSYLCALAVLFNNGNDAKQYLAQETTNHLSKSLLRYNFMQQRIECLQQKEDINEFYQKNKSVLDVIGHYSGFNNYNLLAKSFPIFLELKEKINKIDSDSRICIQDSLYSQ